ncbi:MAG: transcription antitermination factor NusB [Emcibacteraceae bacterium]
MATEKSIKGGARSSARLAAVQALYQIEASGTPSRIVIKEFVDHRLGELIDDEQFARADNAFFIDLVSGVDGRSAEIDDLITSNLTDSWSLERIESVARAVIRSSVYEILARPDVPTNVIINEYVDVTKAFFDDSTPAFVNGILDKIAKLTRE